MPTYSKSLVIFTLFAVLWLENKAHRCGFPHEKTHEKFAKGIINADFKCNTGTVPSCRCGIGLDSYYYPMPKSGNCKDVFKRLSTTPSDYHFREEKCYKVHRAVCRVDSTCENDAFIPDDQIGTPPQTPDEFLIGQNSSEPFCMCDYDNSLYDMPKSGNCTDLETTSDNKCSGSYYKAENSCRDTCYCNESYVKPTECVPQTCNYATEAFCKCGIDDVHYPVPESGNCMDVIKQLSTTPSPSYQYRFGYHCYKVRTVCKCIDDIAIDALQSTDCECNDECESGCDY